LDFCIYPIIIVRLLFSEIVQILRKDNIAKRSLHYVLPYGIEANVVRIFYIWKEKGEYLQIKMKKLKKESDECYRLKLLRKSR